MTDQQPAAMRLTRRRRCVLYLRAAGWSYAAIAARLDVSENVVRKDLHAINTTLIPGLTDGEEPAKGYRIIYALGLLDAGVPPEDVVSYLEAIPHRVAWLLARRGRIGPDQDDNLLADMAP